MARVGGRSLWLAWPVGVMCAGVVGALAWMAAPGLPGAVEFVGNTLRGATSAPVADGAGTPPAPSAAATDCRDIYPDRLWSELTWTPDALLSQTTAPPATATALAAALAPDVRLTCTWRVDDGRSVATTVATVGADAAAVARAALSAEGFTCSADGDAAHCARTSGTVTEIHDLRGRTWLSSVLTGWMPQDYAAQVASRVFAGG
jgi:hypothetical protein